MLFFYKLYLKIKKIKLKNILTNVISHLCFIYYLWQHLTLLKRTSQGHNKVIKHKRNMLLLGCDKAENKRENYARDGKQQTHTHTQISCYRVEIII